MHALAPAANPDRLTPEEWRYVGAAALGALGMVALAVGYKRRQKHASNPCALDVYTQVLGREGVTAEVAQRAWTFAPLIESTASAFGISPALLMGLVHTESKFNPMAGSGAGAVGLTQYMPSTAVSRFRSLYEAGMWPFEQVVVNHDPQANSKFADEGVEAWLDRTDPAQAVWLGAAGLRALMEKYGDVETALAVYNAGPNVAGKPHSQWPGQTRAYVPAVLERTSWYEEVLDAC